MPRRYNVRVGRARQDHVRSTSDLLGVLDPRSVVVGGASSWPWPQSTSEVGIASGVTLTPSGVTGQWTLSTPGAVVEGFEHDGDILIRANNITLRNCKVNGGKINTSGDGTGPALSGTLVERCEVDGLNGVQEMGINGSNATIRRCYVHGTSNGMRSVGGYTVEDSVVDGLVVTDPQAHVSGFGMNGGTDVAIRRSVIAARTVPQASGSIVFYAQEHSRRVTLEDNLIIGGGYAAYLGWDSTKEGDPLYEPQDIVVRRNRWSREHYPQCGFNGAARAWNTNKPGHIWTDNWFADKAPSGGIYNVVDAVAYPDPGVVS